MIQEFCGATEVATINELKIVPLITFLEEVILGLKKIDSFTLISGSGAAQIRSL